MTRPTFAFLIVGLLGVVLLATAAPAVESGSRRSPAVEAPVPLLQAGLVTVSVTTDRVNYALGEPVQFTLTVRNPTQNALIFTRPTSQEYDFIVRTSGGAEVWRWSHDRAFLQVIETTTFLPGQARTFTETWEQRDNNGQQVVAGTYAVTGVFTSSPPIESPPHTFTIGLATPTATPTATATPTVTPTVTPTPSPGQDRWFDRPPAGPGAMATCPSAGQWLLLYWGGTEGLPIATAATACPAADIFWVSRQGRWLGFAKTRPEASDTWNVLRGEAHFVHGAGATAGTGD